MEITARKVNFSTKFMILKRKPILLLFGFLFTIMPLFMILIFTIVFTSIGDDTPQVDHELINKKGKIIVAEITNLQTQHNVTINGVHPTIITYTYSKNGTTRISKYKALEDRKIELLEIGGTVEIKEFNGDSIVLGFAPGDLSTGLFTLPPLIFMLIGLPFLIYAIVNLRKELKLYKFGKVSKGKIVSMIPKSGLPVSGAGQGILVHYEYETTTGHKRMGESFTSDFSIVNDKKKGEFTPIFVSAENEEKSCIVPKLSSLRNGWNIDFD